MLFLILGVILIVVGFLGLFHLIALSLPISLVLVVVGLLMAVLHDRVPYGSGRRAR